MASLHGHTMGTYWTLQWHDAQNLSIDRIQQALNTAFDRVIAQMSHFDPTSELSQINRSAPYVAQPVSAEFCKVLEFALSISQKTDGAYNPNLAKLSSAYGFGPDPNFTLPEESSYAMPWVQIQVDSNKQTLVHQATSLQLDLSSIAKGFALDLAGKQLKEIGVSNFLLEIGGEFLASGCKPNAMPWWVELENPEPELQKLRFGITKHAIATSASGITQKAITSSLGTTIDVHHLLDPEKGAPTCHSLLSVTVLAANCMNADAWATALFILGKDKGLKIASQEKICAVFTEKGQHYLSPCMLTLLEDE